MTIEGLDRSIPPRCGKCSSEQQSIETVIHLSLTSRQHLTAPLMLVKSVDVKGWPDETSEGLYEVRLRLWDNTEGVQRVSMSVVRLLNLVWHLIDH